MDLNFDVYVSSIEYMTTLRLVPSVTYDQHQAHEILAIFPKQQNPLVSYCVWAKLFAVCLLVFVIDVATDNIMLKLNVEDFV